MTNLDAAPAARADSEQDRTDKAATCHRHDGTGDTPVSDRPKPINDARLAALEELSALDQALELQYGLIGNPMIKAQQHTPQANATPREGTERSEGTEPAAWGITCDGELLAAYTCEDEESANEMVERFAATGMTGHVIVPLYRSPPDWAFLNDEIARLRLAIRRLADQDATLSVCDRNVTVTMDAALTDAEREAVEQAIDAANGMGQAEPWTMRTLRGLLERLK